MTAPVFAQQAVEPSRVGFRNSDSEPWLWYRMPLNDGHIMYSPCRTGRAPRPDLKPVSAI